MKKLVLLALLAPTLACQAQWDLNKTIDKAKQETDKVLNGGSSGLTQDEVVKGLREALSVGTNKSATSASKTDGFYKNPAIKIPFPPEAIKVKNTVEDLGMQKQVNEFVLTLNRAAEEASKEAAPIFLDAIKSMSISDGFSILKGADNAATTYLHDKTNAQLAMKFRPIVKNAIQKVQVTKYWNPIITRYNQVPFTEKVNPDLEAYVTEKALEGLFKMIADEELKIRKDPAARITDILKKVFA